MVNGYKWPIKYDYFARSVSLSWAEWIISTKSLRLKNRLPHQHYSFQPDNNTIYEVKLVGFGCELLGVVFNDFFDLSLHYFVKKNN